MLNFLIQKQNHISRTVLELYTPLIHSLDGDVQQLVEGVKRHEHTRASWYRKPWYEYLKAGSLIKYFVAQTSPVNEGLISRLLVIDFRPQILKLQLALRQYELRHGRLPESLDLLVPQFIESVPLDSMDGQPLRWNAKTQRLYSVGWDLKDDGGSYLRPWHDGLTSGDRGMEYLWKPEEARSKERNKRRRSE